MKKLQNDFTTPEQSNMLLELGVPVWTANIMFDINRKRYELIDTEDESLAETQRTLLYNGGAIPHWTVGRLKDIARLSTALPKEDYMYPFWDDTYSNIDWAIGLLECGAKTKHLDFSKLEE